MQPYVYIMASQFNGTLYIGVTSHLEQRIWQHKNAIVDGFTHKYKVDQLVYFEVHASMYDAICREKQLKKWRREWKINLINSQNPKWEDLWYTVIVGSPHR
ncbi:MULTISPECIES: GIY-YIG nuclease family protein [Shewanella]|uniref:Excinuclease ABC, C subunit domain protein n=2 Tax=Shewanella putrefaciens TaxID=24 RepID=A4Y8G2_SHEPC|nr:MULTISPECIES: GIY-YIG nuclease family protein [Shewanella]ABM24322.1 Excinuclease ABC, C subunit domain protein [Shewanella sp. W3-18-1]AVV86052.1 endonuclease excinuclease ABC subunit C [Shewanella putrefaciens]MCT8945134.1 GIY-YIG nuclease family protein [Shewanella putrefaciens]QGS49359.1 GIY-YIG nuclease family protein [Shewanella putrefaciens]QSE48222.1 GIY-YIG nuclease family protein [Shewanella putrefaciens]